MSEKNINQEQSNKHEISRHASLAFLPCLFGKYYVEAESRIYNRLGQFCKEYHGANWLFFKVGTTSGFIMPDISEELYIEISSNYFQRKVSPEAAGVIVTLYELNHLCWAAQAKGEQRLCAGFIKAIDELKDYAETLHESSLIFAAID
ncbi:antirestriction protein [Cronobacter sakazakii]|uniref:antirestriction protein n=1 Tax=Cronobacter sakazakii TaxID=28141 RepID=UPI00131A31FC|nr:antirestriction protein [Cronobacter sakazakii]MDK1225388.1 antirestriction protein [Cronobacter turicensis]EMC4401917.1 antirestriction protein [Cronobacter sakazakii]MBF4659328.1 antirestriction protein [Cronobacter sakazakii]MBF4834642.1 antirestriction protein [Cronobacter sakazakii]MBF4867932.1 antirestriction protein [Cronobacter sakazakii]